MKIEPEALGPLADRPLAEKAQTGDAAELFPGASGFLAARHQRKRQAQWNAVRPLAERLLRPDERILHVVHAMQVPPTLHALSLGAMTMAFHQVVLVVTDTRLIEVMLDFRGKAAGTRLRSFPWNAVRELRVKLGKLVVVPPAGRKLAWRVPLRGDRRLLQLLAERLKARLLTSGASAAETLPLWHCPQCGGAVPREPQACAACQATFRSKKLVSILALAFPGAGLLYAGHPFLATMDFFGEIFAYAVFVLLLLQAEPGSVGIASGFGALLFAITKLESIHLGRMLVARSRPETNAQRAGYTRLAWIGALVSTALIGGAFPLAGRARPILDRDLDLAVRDEQWHGSRDRAEWDAFADDATARSQWWHEDGLRITVFAYPQSLLSSASDFRNDLRAEFRRSKTPILADDEDVPAPFHGFRFVTRGASEDGTPIALINYFVVDGEHHDVHQALAAVIEEDAEAADEMVRGFLGESHFIASARR
ncbi:MAG TPA: hypothetical protein VJS92_18180 [Candidatus Polarisedimenticolaceae bacterium]|nr:hypothetical protein [Candidatus Polarisedimenticolaceae bacterium]